MAEVMQNSSSPAWMAESRSLTDTSVPTKPSSSANPWRIPNTTGVMEMDWACFTRYWVSPAVSHRLLAGHTAS